MSTEKVRLLTPETLDGLDEMLPGLHVTGKLAQELVALARWAAKAHALLLTLQKNRIHLPPLLVERIETQLAALLRDVEAPPHATEGRDDG